MRPVHALSLLLPIAAALADPLESPWPTEGAQATSDVHASRVSGRYAVADTHDDEVEIRDIRTTSTGLVESSAIGASLPWMTFSTGPDGPGGIALTDSGRLAFIVVRDDEPAPDGLPNDALLRYDVHTSELDVFARLDVTDDVQSVVPTGIAHFRGLLYTGSSAGVLHVHRAERNDRTGILLDTIPLGLGAITGLAIESEGRDMYIAAGPTIARMDLDDRTFEVVGDFGHPIRGVTWSWHFGAPGQEGLKVLTDGGIVHHVPLLQARGFLTFDPASYHATEPGSSGLASTACGRLLVGSPTNATMIRDDDDPRLDFESWIDDEFMQVLQYANGLVAPDGEPDGWVIDGDVAAGGTRFHPASPDAAAWVVLLNLVHDALHDDPSARARGRTILRRYAGRMPDGIAPGLSADGQIRHWCDPFSTTGAEAPGWPDEFASLSTMKIVAAATRASNAWPDDQEIIASAREIVERVVLWDAYIERATDAMYLKSAGSVPDLGSAVAPFFEGYTFLEQADAFGGPHASAAFDRWSDRSRWPTASWIAGRPITGNAFGAYQAAFVTLYPLLLESTFATDPAWRAHIDAMDASYGAWTDDHGPRYMTVFSAGTTKPEWGGYNADDLGHHPGDITTFPSLMAFGATGETHQAVGAYHAYRRGARQSWATGASMLYRRSDADRGYAPNVAGLPDVALGALGLAELRSPGVIASTLHVDSSVPGSCAADLNEDAEIDVFDVLVFLELFETGDEVADFNDDGLIDVFDVFAFLTIFDSCL